VRRWRPARASEVQALRHHLLSLACDADVVLDLHCDDRAILHLYADPAWQAEAGVVAAFLGIETVLLSQESGGYSFDEACGLPWHRLAARFPQWQHGQPGCMAVTVELRGQQDVNHALRVRMPNVCTVICNTAACWRAHARRSRSRRR
jgi:predicted deacylase